MALAALFLGCAGAAAADSVPPDFRMEFEKVFPPRQGYAVVMAEGVPTLGVGGAEGNVLFKFHYSIDIVEGRWHAPQPFLKVDQAQTPNAALAKGEVLKLSSVAYKKDRVELQLVSTEPHTISRGSRDVRRELVATKFNFCFPFHLTGPADLPKALDYIAAYLKPFPNEEAARAFGRQLAGGR